MNDTEEVSVNDRLGFTLFVAIAAHAFIILSVGFDVNKGEKVAPMLNVTLATHKSNIAPEKADFIAQHNQQASGSANEVRELTAKEVAMLDDVRIRDVSEAPQVKTQRPTKDQHQLVHTTSEADRLIQKQKLEDLQEEKQEYEGDANETILENPEYASLQAKLDKIKQEIASQPRIRRLTSVSTKESYDAKYLNDWAQKVEFVGNENFPELALKNEIFGHLRLSVLILPNGYVERVEILQSSGHGILDEAARHIVKLASPFAPFPKEIRKQTDKIEIIRTWRFEITGLKTTR